jgi:hypothetical protein
MKSLHHLIPICAVALCTLLMATAAAAGTTHASTIPTATTKTIAPATTTRQVSTLGAASSASSSPTRTVPRMDLVRENDNQIAGKFCIAHWQDSSCRGVAALHDEALKMQQNDGGKLTPEHLKQLQTKLDAVLADVQSKLDAARPPSG